MEWPIINSIMNWDWDKLQEKRQRQNWGQHQDSPEEPRDSDDHRPPPSKPSLHEFKLPPLSAPGKNGIKWLVLLLAVVWLASGIYIVNPDEQGVVLRFGKYNRTVDAGPHYALPFPIESVDKPKVTQVQRVEVGFRSVNQNRLFQQGEYRPLPEEALTLTGDENIVNVQFSVQYQIKDAVQYLYNVTNQAAVVKNAAEAAMREVIGNSLIDSALTDGKLQIQHEATVLLQEILDRYKVGVRILAVQLQDVHPPREVIDAFKDVASAREDKSRIINEAEAYRNELIPKARGQAAEIENKALAYKETRIRNAEGEAVRFLALLDAYNLSRDVTRKRLYLEAMEEILSKPGMEKILLTGSTGSSVLPLLPLLEKPSRQSAASAARPAP